MRRFQADHVERFRGISCEMRESVWIIQVRKEGFAGLTERSECR